MNAKSLVKFFAMVLLVMVGIYIIKFAAKKVNIPVISNIAEEV